MNAVKPWYYSKTIWASIVTVMLSVGGILGIPIRAIDPQIIADLLVQLVTALAGITAIFGRLSATDQIE